LSALLADIGGTNARFALLEGNELGAIEALKVADYADPPAAVKAFLATQNGASATTAWLDIAGPVTEGEGDLTNSAWHISARQIERACGFDAVHVLNDFEALAWSLPELPRDAYEPVGGDTPMTGEPLAVLGPGTGLGVAAYVPGPGRGAALVGEGGHVTMAASDEREAEVLAYLRDRHEHVSAERVLSGPGLEDLYAAIAAIDGHEPAARAAAEITAHAEAGDCAASSAALDCFCAMLGTVAGDVALTLGARGGVYIAGGIVPQLLEAFRTSRFRARFEAKGRLRAYLTAVPTHVITHPYPAMLGLRRLATATG
jgi:glucokinase